MARSAAAVPLLLACKRDLLVAGAAGKAAVEDFAELVDLVPGDDALLDRIEDAGLPLALDQFAPIGDDEIGAPHGLVVVLAPAFLEPAALDQRAVGADHRHDVLPGLDPGAVEHRHVRAGGADHHVGIAHHLARRLDGHELGVDQASPAARRTLCRFSGLRL